MSMDIVNLAQAIATERDAELARTLEHRRVAAGLAHTSAAGRARRRASRGIRRGYLVALRHVTEPPAAAA